MILRRLAQAVRRQDWFTVVVEFVIVVMGVFIGIQFSNWNEARRDHAEEKVILGRLSEEISANLEATLQVANSHRQREQIIRSVIQALQGDPERMPEESKVQTALCRWFVVPTSSIATDSFDELVSAGKLGLIRDAETRRLIMTAYAAHTQSGDQIALLTNAVREIARGISAYILWQLGDGGSWPGSYHCLFDFKGMAGDPIAMSRLVQLARGQQNYAYFRQIEADAAAAALTRLSPPGEGDTP